jgi:hypothetical protein
MRFSDRLLDWRCLMAKFQVYKDKSGEWRWRLRADNNEPVADSNEGYKAKADCRAAVDLVKRLAPTAAIEDQT